MTMTTHTDPSPGAMRAAEKIHILYTVPDAVIDPVGISAHIIDAETGAAELAAALEAVHARRIAWPAEIERMVVAALARYRKGGK